jgi:S-ribosylhomocysteine lyase
MGDYESADIVPLMRETFEFIANFQGEVPGATPRDCGNYSFMDLDEARSEAQRFLNEVLNVITDANLNYPQ